MNRFLAALLLFATVAAHAETHEELVTRAFSAMEPDLAQNWSYTRTTRNSEGTFIARFDPRMPDEPHWTLLSVDGRKPTDGEIEEFLDDVNRDRGGNGGDENGAEFTAGSLRLIEETDEYWWFSFLPPAESEEDAKFMNAVDARLKIVKKGHFVSHISMRNTDTIKPGKGVKIRKFETDLRFAPACEGCPAVPRSVKAAVQGKALLLMKIDEEENIEFSDFERVED